MMNIAPVARERRHTLHMLNEIRAIAPVFLDTEIDMTEIRRHQRESREGNHGFSLVTYVLYTAARVLARHPEANAAIQGRKIARYASVSGKLVLDKTINAQRVVLSAVIPNLNEASLQDVQRQVDRYRDGDPVQLPEFAAARVLHRLPWPLGAAAFRLGVRPLRRRAAAFGTFAVSSLGHRPVDGFYAVGGTTITLGVGRVTDRPVVRGNQVMIAPIMRLNLTFDHRVIDGAEAADVLTGIKDGLEGFGTTAFSVESCLPSAVHAGDGPAMITRPRLNGHSHE